MANTVDVTIIEQGERNAVVLVYLQSDGATGDLVNEPILTLSELGLPANARLKLNCLQSMLAGFHARLEFDTGLVEKNPKWVMPEGQGQVVKFSKFGFVFDNSGPGRTGTILLTTTGMTATGDEGSFLLAIVK